MADENAEQPPQTPDAPATEPTPPATEPTPPPAEPASPTAAGKRRPAAEPKPEAAAEAEDGEAKTAVRRRPRGGKHVPVGIVFIKATFNNTQVSIADPQGNVISWGSSGRSGFKGSRKSTAFAATVVAQDAARQAVGMGMQEVEVRVQGPGAGRESAIRALQSSGLTVTSIKDVTAIPHNGCRPPKRRRV
jgi:small subunit ribosomal protein S11